MKAPWFILLLYILVSCHAVDKSKEQESELQSLVIASDLSNQQIKSIAEDAQGHIWIGTFRGLNKFNANEYHQYFCADDSLGLLDNQIQDILLDSKKQLWIATVNGVCQYTDQDNFVHIPINASNKNMVQLIENKEGRMFFNAVLQLYAYNPLTKSIDCVIPNLDPNHTFNVRCYIDDNDKLWVVSPRALVCYDSSTLVLKDSISLRGTPSYSFMHNKKELWLTGNHTIAIFDTQTHQFKELPQAIKQHPLLSNANIEYIHPYGDNSLLINTSKHGMFYYNFIDNTVTHQEEDGFPFEVPPFKISKIFTDSQKNLWFGSLDQGISVSYHYKERFNNNNYLRSALENKSVVSIAAEKNHNIWISTLMNGLYVYDIQNQRMENIAIEKLFPQEKQRAIYVNQIFVDNTNDIWMTATNNTVLKCSYINGNLKIKAQYNVFYPMSITQDHYGTMWIGTASVYLYALKQGDTEFRPIKMYDTRFTFIPSLLPLKSGSVLIAAFNQPMKLIDSKSLQIKELAVSPQDMKTSIRRSVFIPTAIYEDTQGEMWIGTVSNGLLCYSPQTGKIRPVPGTACLDISGIEEDKQGLLWISTQYGLSKYDRIADKFSNYYAADGIGGNQFYDRSSCPLPDGTLLFGGTHGLTFFNPADIPIKRNIPILFQDLKIDNRLIRPAKGECIDKHLSYKPNIQLKHYQNSFSISFAAPDYCEHGRVHYHYMLENFDKDWIDAGNNHEAYYANLPSGKYSFKVKITNNDKSIIEAEDAIQVTVKPAPWATWWAYSIYFIIAAGIIGLFISIYLRIRSEKKLAQKAEQEKEQEQRVNKMNMSFFANVSHEFRTPLTMIAGPVNQLCNNPEISGDNKALLFIVQRSVERMLRLVNQLMDFHKLENDTIKLKVSKIDIISFLQQLVEVYRTNAKEKGITLNTFGLEDSLLAWVDEDKMDKIFGNLMSNALKFTPIGGCIEVHLDLVNREEACLCFTLTEKDKDLQFIQISVSNTGQTIPDDKLDKIFERYYQMTNQNEGTYNWGTGIGLYYARSLTQIHHGYIKAGKSDNGQGVVFTFILPINDISYEENERSKRQKSQTDAFPLIQEKTVYMKNEDSENTEKQNSILVIDDDTEVVHYLKTLLSPYYKIIYRFDANSALQALKEDAPDLILSDVVMPGKNGYEFCREIKEDLQLCHIPVILVTAKATVQNQVEGLNTGADAYVTKPFDPSYLLALISSLLRNREKVRNLLGRATQTDKLDDNILSPQDKSFMTNLYQLMENELSNPELDVARMTEMLKISRTKFYYKVKGLTGENPSFFFKTYKLNRAAELLVEGKYTVSEIADLTGFSTLSHFSKSFKKQFGITPSEYNKT